MHQQLHRAEHAQTFVQALTISAVVEPALTLTMHLHVVVVEILVVLINFVVVKAVLQSTLYKIVEHVELPVPVETISVAVMAKEVSYARAQLVPAVVVNVEMFVHLVNNVVMANV